MTLPRISAPPITYKINDKQYVALLVGWEAHLQAQETKALLGLQPSYPQTIGAPLKEEPRPQQPPPHFPQPLADPDFIPDPELIAVGADLYWRCFGCHGVKVIAKGMAPDLRASPIVASQSTFNSVVRDGIKADMGMPAYKDLTDEDLKALRHFIKNQAYEATTGQAQ
jgi:quinohemoprotein ethanol dehydrogenase